MVETFKVKGQWWLPENPDVKLPGTLSYNPDDGAVLELIGAFDLAKDLTGKNPEYDIINGIAGSEITLYKCYNRNSNLQIPGILSSVYYANYVFKGHIFAKESEIKFKFSRFSYNYLEAWANRSGMIINHSNDGSINVTTTALKPVTASIGENLRIRIINPVEDSFTWKDGGEVRLKQKAFIEVETMTALSFEEFMKISYKIQQFLTLATNKPIHRLEFKALISSSDNGEKERPIEVFSKIDENALKTEILHPNQIPLSLDIIHDRFEEIFNIWLGNEKSSLLDPIFNLYFASRFNDKMYIENIFLNLVSCLESYHRRRFGGKYLQDEKYEEFTKSIKSSLPQIADPKYSDLKTKFIHGLKYGNELSLRNRLKLIVEDNNHILSKYIKNLGQFIDKVVDTRNYRTHFDKDLERKGISDTKEFYWYNVKLEMIVEICIFKELGLNNDEIEKIFSRNQKYNFMLSQSNSSCL